MLKRIFSSISNAVRREKTHKGEGRPATFLVSVAGATAGKSQITIKLDLGEPLNEAAVTDLFTVLEKMSEEKFKEHIHKMLMDKAGQRGVGGFMQNLIKVSRSKKVENTPAPEPVSLEEQPPAIRPLNLSKYHWHKNLVQDS